jgi:hypothetical protein
VADERLRDAERAFAAAQAAVRAASTDHEGEWPRPRDDDADGMKRWEHLADVLCEALEQQGQALRRLNKERRRAGLPVLLRRCDRRKKPRRHADEDELTMARALAGCSFTPGTWDKRFARDLAAQLRATEQITQAQAENLRRMVHRYRRQIPAEVVALAGRGCAPGVDVDAAGPGDPGPLFGAP